MAAQARPAPALAGTSAGGHSIHGLEAETHATSACVRSERKRKTCVVKGVASEMHAGLGWCGVASRPAARHSAHLWHGAFLCHFHDIVGWNGVAKAPIFLHAKRALGKKRGGAWQSHQTACWPRRGALAELCVVFSTTHRPEGRHDAGGDPVPVNDLKEELSAVDKIQAQRQIATRAWGKAGVRRATAGRAQPRAGSRVVGPSL